MTTADDVNADPLAHRKPDWPNPLQDQRVVEQRAEIARSCQAMGIPLPASMWRKLGVDPDTTAAPAALEEAREIYAAIQYLEDAQMDGTVPVNMLRARLAETGYTEATLWP